MILESNKLIITAKSPAEQGITERGECARKESNQTESSLSTQQKMEPYPTT